MMRPSDAELPEFDDNAMFPDIPMQSLVKSEMHVIEVGVIIDQEELDTLIVTMYEHPERTFYHFQEKDRLVDLVISRARDSHEILMDKIEFGFYRHPRYRRHFVRIKRQEIYPFEWEKEVVDKGPEFMRFELRLTERKKRQLQIAETITAQKAADDSSPLVLKPSWMGMGLDLPKAWRWVKGKLGKSI